MNKKGQVTIFIIIGIVLVSIVATFFLFRSGILPSIGGEAEKNPNAFLQSCLQDKIMDGVKLISIHGGDIEPQLLSIPFKFEANSEPMNISYLCYTSNYYLLCNPQQAMLISHIEEELHNYISEDVADCFNRLGASLEKGGFEADLSYRSFEVNMNDGKIIIPIDAGIVLTKTEETKKYENFSFIIPSKIYDLAFVAQEIVNAESTNGEFKIDDLTAYPQLVNKNTANEEFNYNLAYAEFDINKLKTTDSAVVYKIKHIDSKEEFYFAVRGSVIKPGWF